MTQADSLGRVVIPKEIRHTLRIKEGSPLEIYTEKDGGVTFRKYSPLGDLQDFAVQICDAIRKNTGAMAAVADRDGIIAVAGANRRELVERPNSPDLERIMEARKLYRCTGGERIRPTEQTDKYHLGLAAPITAQGDLVGCVMMLLEEDTPPLSDADQKLLQTVAEFLGKQMEH